MTDKQSVKIPVAPGTFYQPGLATPGSGLKDAYGTAYVVEKSGALRRVGKKQPKRTLS